MYVSFEINRPFQPCFFNRYLPNELLIGLGHHQASRRRKAAATIISVGSFSRLFISIASVTNAFATVVALAYIFLVQQTLPERKKMVSSFENLRHRNSTILDLSMDIKIKFHKLLLLLLISSFISE